MIGFTLRRLVQAVIVLLGLTVLVFLLEHIIPGSLARAILGPRADPGEIAAFDRVNGLDRPVVSQYLTFLSHVLHGNLGYSYRLNQSVDSLVVHELPNDLILVGIALVPRSRDRDPARDRPGGATQPGARPCGDRGLVSPVLHAFVLARAAVDRGARDRCARLPP